MRRVFLAAGLVAVFVGPSLADPALTVASSNMRRAANPYSRIVQAIPANAQIDIQSCGGDWCYGSWRGLYGFIPSFAVAQSAPPAPPMIAAPPPPLVVTAPVVVAPPPPVYRWGGPYVGVGWGYGWGRW